MTLDDVMKLSGRDLDAAVAERLGWNGPVSWCDDEDGRDPYMFPPTAIGYAAHMTTDRGWDEIVPNYSADWNAAMAIREWARRLKRRQQSDWGAAVFECMSARLGDRHYAVIFGAEPVDYARAALVVSP